MISQPVDAAQRVWRVAALTDDQISELRQARQEGASMNQLCLRYFGFKDDRTLALVRQAVSEG